MNWKRKLDKARDLNHRWNRAMSKFAAGSEYIDDPERVAEHIERSLYLRDLLDSKKRASFDEEAPSTLPILSVPESST